MAAELVKNPRIPHSFVHDLESAYFVLLSHGIRNMNHTLPEGEAASMVHDILDSRRYGSGGGLPKFYFMNSWSSMSEYEIPSNKPFATLLHELHIKHNTRYIQLDSKSLSAEELANLRPSFMTPEALMADDFNHEVFIDIMDKALKSEGWPTDDHAVSRHILRSNSSIALSLIKSSSERSRTWDEDGSNTSTNDRGSKRLNSGSAV
jgi:hypothetical protein